MNPNPPGEGRHEAMPPKGNPFKVLFIVLAIVLILGIVILLLWIFVFSKGGGGTPTNTPTQTDARPTQTVSPPPLATCDPSSLTAELLNPTPGAGVTQVPINFTNTGDASCTLEGFPIVLMLWNDGLTFGAGAHQDHRPGAGDADHPRARRAGGVRAAVHRHGCPMRARHR